MPSLGTFGTAREPLDLDFEWFGAIIRVNPDASDLGFMEFMENAEKVQLPDSIEGLDPDEQIKLLNSLSSVTDAMNQFVREQIHPDDWAEFWQLAKKNRQQNADLMQLSRDITAGVTRFRTGRSSGSTGTPSSTAPKLTAVASSPVDLRREAVAQAAAVHLDKRPDLRLILRNQARAERAAEEMAAGRTAASQTAAERLLPALGQTLGPPRSA
jgi:hypothetical protein